MLKAILFLDQGLHSSLSSSTFILRTCVPKAFISTNTAILRGVRKSVSGVQRSKSGAKYDEDRKGRFSAESRKVRAERRYPKSSSDFGSKYTKDETSRFSAEPRTFGTKQKSPETSRDYGSKNRREKKGEFPANPSTFGSGRRYPEVDRKDPWQKYPGSRSNSGSKHSGERRGGFSPDSRRFDDDEQSYPRASRDGLGSRYDGDGKGRFSAESRTSTAKRRHSEANRSEPRFRNDGDRRKRFSAENEYPRVKTNNSGIKYDGDRKERFLAEQKYPRVETDKSRIKYDEDRRSRFSADLREFQAEQRYSRANKNEPRAKNDGHRKERFSAEQKHSRVKEDYSGIRNEKDRTSRFSANLQKLSAELNYPEKDQDVDDVRGSVVRESKRTSAYADSVGQYDSKRPGVKRFEREYPPNPIEVHGMDVKSNPPRGIPYTTSASEFLYGTFAVMAALKFSDRKLYKVYIYAGENRSPISKDEAVRKLALARGVEVVNVTGEWLQIMHKMSDGRPHNGFILEASPLPKLPVTGLQRVHRDQRALKVSFDHQSFEEEVINGTNDEIRFQPAFTRYPFVLFLSGVTDPGNLGAIIRSAFCFGVDAIAMSKRTTAPLSAVTIKASAGAAESLPLLSVDKPEDFVSQSSLNGWKIYAAVLPQKLDSWRRGSFTNNSLGSPILDHPCLLMIGAEGEGLARSLQKKADFAVSVEGARMDEGGVDSLNVSVASAMLCEAFLRKGEVRQRSERAQSEQAGTGKADHTRHVDIINEEETESDSNVIIPGEEDPQQTYHIGFGEEEEEEEREGSEAIDETKAHHHLKEESVSAPKHRLF